MNKSSKTKKALLFRVSFFVKSHPTLLFVVLSGYFLLVPNNQFVQAGWFNNLTSPTAWINGLIYPFFLFFSWIVNLAAGIFVWAIDAATFTKLMNAGAIYEVWLIVRDFLNIFFILALLFSAFATIFHLDRFEYKRTIPMLVLMALLVNFSFPIARFVIDLANVPMYFFSQSIFGVNGPNEITSGILSGAKMQNILIPGGADKELKDFETTHLLAATICMFLFGLSFLVLSVLMMVRMIALAILVMFSPIGFVGMITPALQSFAKGWWDKLFKWAFYGPIAVMFVLVAVIVMKSAGESIYPSAGAGGVFQSTGSSVNDNMVSAVAFFSIPIVLFWIAITSTEKYSNDISGLGIKWGSNLGRWGAKQMRGGAVWGAKLPMKSVDRLSGNRISGTALGIREAWRNRRGWGGKDMKERQERASMLTEGFLSNGLAGRNAAKEGLIRKRAQEMVEKNKKFNRTDADIQKDLDDSTGTSEQDRIKRRAAALTMADRETLSDTDNFSKALKAVGDDMESIGRIVRKAPKELLQNAEDLVKSFDAINSTSLSDPNAKKRLKSQLIDKAGGGALAKTGADYERMVTALGDSDLEKALQSKMGREGKIKAVLEYKVKGVSTPDGKFKAYDDILKDFDATDLGKQTGLMDVKEFKDYFRQKGILNQYDADFFAQYMKVAKGGKRAAFRDHVIDNLR